MRILEREEGLTYVDDSNDEDLPGGSATSGPRRLWDRRGRRCRELCNAIGIIFSIIVALALLGAGYLLISTFIGILLGLPFMIFGAFLLARALY